TNLVQEFHHTIWTCDVGPKNRPTFAQVNMSCFSSSKLNSIFTCMHMRLIRLACSYVNKRVTHSGKREFGPRHQIWIRTPISTLYREVTGCGRVKSYNLVRWLAHSRIWFGLITGACRNQVNQKDHCSK